jgi:hypothetical protein
MVDKHLFNLFSCPILYKTSFFIVKGEQSSWLAIVCALLIKIIPYVLFVKTF